jgi:hypothetical protein
MADGVRQAATNAFDHGLSIGCIVAGAAAVAGALLAAAFLPAHPPQQPEPQRHPAGAAETTSDHVHLRAQRSTMLRRSA